MITGATMQVNDLEASFSSLEEAYAFIRSKEELTNTKFVLKKKKTAGRPNDITSTAGLTLMMVMMAMTDVAN